MTQTIDSLISEAEVELFEISPFDGQTEFVGYKVDQKELVRLTAQTILSLIAIEQDKVDQNWVCKDGIHISWKIMDKFGLK
jgi:hypothetical protein